MPPMLMLEVEKGLKMRGGLAANTYAGGKTVRGSLAANAYAGGRERVNSEGRSCRQYLCWR